MLLIIIGLATVVQCPRTGPIFVTKRHAHYRYKLAERNAKQNFCQAKVDSLNDDLLHGEHHKFWQLFKYYNRPKVPQSARIDGLSDDYHITCRFAESYKKVYDSYDRVPSDALSSKFNVLFSQYVNEHNGDSIKRFLLSWSDMLDVMSKLKAGKASGTFIKPEHVLYGSPKLVWHLHWHVLSEFLKGVVCP